MNNILYRERYDEISSAIAVDIKVATALDSYAPEDIMDCDSFAVLDNFILRWITECLINENTGAKLRDLDILAVCEYRCKKHFGAKYQGQYQMLSSAFHIIGAANYSCPDDMENIIKQYLHTDCLLDGYYREFYYFYDQLSDATCYEKLRDLVENIYTNEYLAKVMPRWNAAYLSANAMSVLPLQRKPIYPQQQGQGDCYHFGCTSL